MSHFVELVCFKYIFNRHQTNNIVCNISCLGTFCWSRWRRSRQSLRLWRPLLEPWNSYPSSEQRRQSFQHELPERKWRKQTNNHIFFFCHQAAGNWLTADFLFIRGLLKANSVHRLQQNVKLTCITSLLCATIVLFLGLASLTVARHS